MTEEFYKKESFNREFQDMAKKEIIKRLKSPEKLVKHIVNQLYYSIPENDRRK